MLFGHQKIWQFLINSAQKDNLSHAFLFSGPEKVGKKTLAFHFIKWLFGKDGWKGNNHPDLVFIEPKGGEIQIEQIRELIWKISLCPIVAPLKAGIVDQAHLMNYQAQNCFLKTLEEPKGKAILILVTEFPESLLPTISSRCQKIKFSLLKKEEMEKIVLKFKKDKKEIEEIIRITQGKPGLALELINHPERLKEKKRIWREIERLSKEDLAWRFQYAKKVYQSQKTEEFLDLWLTFFREKLLSSLDNDLQKVKYFKNLLEKIQNTRILISQTKVNPRLALEVLMLDM